MRMETPPAFCSYRNTGGRKPQSGLAVTLRLGAEFVGILGGLSGFRLPTNILPSGGDFRRRLRYPDGQNEFPRR
jgi:hypothetical protein